MKVYDRRRFTMDGDIREEAVSQQPSADERAEQKVEAAAASRTQALEADLQQVRGELEASRRRVDELARAYQALTQEREEFKARLTRERDLLIEVEKGNVALSLLEAIDQLDLCLSASADDKGPLAEGVRLIRENLIAKAQGAGIERLLVVGQPFDPNVAEAADMEMTTSPEEDQKVVSEIRAGYRLKDRVVRPARVKVAKYVQPAQA